ncbi:hypothetical protein [Agrococcus sp. Marseille-Q4369]|nr:hypothetical protein [Agrococcus sp. Marseille-Q4369]QUW18292.1 hypothetical protein JSQ78_10715 [Agrococcus sp. Marseille-Q4369]
MQPADESQLEVGVGPWAGEWPDDERLDPELLDVISQDIGDSSVSGHR